MEGAIATMTEHIARGRPILLHVLLNTLAPMINIIAIRLLRVRD